MKEKDIYNNDSDFNKMPDSLRQNPFTVPSSFFDQQEKEINNQIGLEKLSLKDYIEENSIPSDYFENLENSILGKISELKLKNEVTSDGFDIPQDYFNNLSSSIQSSIVIENLKNIINEDGFETPSQYFNQLEDSIQYRIGKAKLKSIAESDGFVTPEEYFGDMENEIHDKIILEKMLSRETDKSFDVPLGYFEKLESEIYQKIQNDNETPIIPLKSSRINWLKYSAAAVILFIGIGAYFSFDSKTTPSQVNNVSQATGVDLQNVSDEELISYLAQISDDDVDLIDLAKIINDNKNNSNSVLLNSDINDDDIEEYLNYVL